MCISYQNKEHGRSITSIVVYLRHARIVEQQKSVNAAITQQ
jgi:hypothetical protein